VDGGVGYWLATSLGNVDNAVMVGSKLASGLRARLGWASFGSEPAYRPMAIS